MKKLLLFLLGSIPFLGNAQVSNPDTLYTSTLVYHGGSEISRTGWAGYAYNYDSTTSTATPASGGNGYAKAIDSDSVSYWESGGLSSSISSIVYVVNLGTPQTFKGTYLVQRTNSYGYGNIRQMDIYTSSDSSTWNYQGTYYPKADYGGGYHSTAVSTAGGDANVTASNSEKQYFSFAGGAVTAKYYRIVVPNTGNYWYYKNNSIGNTVCIATTGLFVDMASTSYENIASVPDNTLWNRSTWTLTASSVDSLDPSYLRYLVDYNEGTYWQSKYSVPVAAYPHTITVQFATSLLINKIKYIQRNQTSSRIFTGSFYVSNDGSDWIKVYHNDSFPQTSTPQIVPIPSTTVKYLKLEIDSSQYFHANRLAYNGVDLLNYFYATALAELWVGYDATLPVTFAGIKATSIGTSVKIDWSTASETNSDKFEILRSTDSKSFTKIGETKAAGNSTVSNSYTFTDVAPATGTNYYKIKEFDLDGAVTYSDVTSVNIQGTATKFTVAPNPVVTQLKVTLPASAVSTVIRVYNLSGGTVAQKIISAGTTNTFINVSELPSGIYIVKYGAESIKIVKK